MSVAWMCESLRLSVFSNEQVRLSADDWTNLTAQEEADQEQKGAGRHVFTSALFGGQLSLTALGDRCDCILNPIFELNDLSEGSIPTVGDWPARFEDFLLVTEAYLPKFRHPICRLAIGIVLVSPHANRLEAYRELASQLKSINGSVDQFRDFMFRINWPKSSATIDGLVINRLTTWQVLQFQLRIADISAASKSFTSAPTFALRLEMDHNTDVENARPFDWNEVIPIYKELANLALQNAEQGEVL